MTWEILLSKYTVNVGMNAVWYLFFAHILGLRYSIKKTAWFCGINSVLMILVGMMDLLPNDPASLRFFLHMATTLLLLHVAFQGNFFQQLMVLGLQIFVASLAEVAAYLYILEKGYLPSFYLMPLRVAQEALILSLLTQVVLFFVLILLWPLLKVSVSKHIRILCAFLPMSQLMFCSLLAWGIIAPNTLFYRWKILIFIILSVLVDIALLRALKLIREYRETEVQQKILKDYAQQQMQQYEQFAKKHQEMRVFRHDLLSHLHTIQVLMERQDVAEAEQYATQLMCEYHRFAEHVTPDLPLYARALKQNE